MERNKKVELLFRAENELNAAQAKLAELKASTRFSEADRLWSEILTNLQRFYTRLQQASKDGAKTEAWFGRIKKKRSVDPLLLYLQQARHADEHLELQVTETVIDTLIYSKPYDPAVGMKSFEIPETSITISLDEAKLVNVEPHTKVEVKGKFRLVPVTNRGVKYPVPAEHNGIIMDLFDPVNAGGHAIGYLRSTLEEATTFL
ncbi:hypothetical protein [Rhizobium sp. CCGE 510]|uniref:hypothetical protein n=1 Tax=Rhizobium sp. CCGE 510 TaxID=1132836 RepID=UPI00027B88B1|nr:hypothetical protein [Rhizobium sp. CCGE 510]EJT02800.1 hypothetical protein RCCGE510_21749 [Rhizobium sp. CCGE 510]